MSAVCPTLPTHLSFFCFFFKEKALNNNNKEVDRKSVCKPGQNQERSSVFAVFKKVQMTAGESGPLSKPQHHWNILLAFLHVRLRNLINPNVSFSRQILHLSWPLCRIPRKNCHTLSRTASNTVHQRLFTATFCRMTLSLMTLAC